MIKKLLWINLFGFMLLNGGLAHAISPAKQQVMEMSRQINQHLLAGGKEAANDLFLQQFDMSKFGKRCLIDHWDSFTSLEKKRALALLFKNLSKQAREKNFFVRDDNHFELLPQKEIKTADGILEMKTFLETPRKRFSLSLFLAPHQGGFQIVDYEVEGALLSRNYRGHFNYLIRKYGKAGFFERLEKKLHASLTKPG